MAGWSPWEHGAILLAGLALAMAPTLPARALTISATYDSSITGSSNATSIEGAISSALSFYSGFTDPTAVSIDFQLAPSGADYLGGSIASIALTTYASYTGALLTDATTHANGTELTAYSNLGSGNAAQEILATSANLRALGFSTAGNLNSSGTTGGSFDGVVYLNAALIAAFGGSSSYNPMSVIQHEVDEILGIGGQGSVLNAVAANKLSTPPVYLGKTYIGPMDLYRYAAPGVASLTTDGGATAYFSIDGGTTDLVAFNQNSGGDYGDWGAAGCAALVQQAFTCPDSPAQLAAGAPEVIALQAIGYDLTVPEPLSLSLLATGLVGLAVMRRRA